MSCSQPASMSKASDEAWRKAGGASASKQRPIRLCFISSFPPNKARLAEHSGALVGALLEKKVIGNIDIIADKAEGAPAQELISQKATVHRIWEADRPLTFAKVIRAILVRHPDVVHFNMHFQSFGRSRLSNFIGLSMPFFSRLLGFRTIVTIHNLAEKVDLKKVGLKPSLINRISIRLASWLFTRANAVTTTVRSYSRYLRESYGANAFFVPHGAGDPSPAPQKRIKNARDFRILFFGHMSPYKGLSVALDAYSSLKMGSKKVELWIGGQSHPNFTGFLEGYKMKLAGNGVRFLDYVKEEEIPSVFASADVVVLPYLVATGTSGVFHLAASYGKAVVASDLPEIREMVEDGASAFLIPPGDSNALHAALSRLSSDPALAREMATQNRAYAAKNNWSRVASDLISIYNDCPDIRISP